MDEQELQLELNHKTEELNEFKKVLAVFLDNLHAEVDNLTPEDLEWKLRDLEAKNNLYLLDILAENPDLEAKVYSLGIKDIVQLCRTLNWTEYSGYTALQNIKLFIKALARENYTLKQMVGAKQSNGDSRTDNLGSSDTTNN